MLYCLDRLPVISKFQFRIFAGPVCGGLCCGRSREAHLRSALRRVAEESAAAHTRRTAELIMSTKRTLQGI